MKQTNLGVAHVQGSRIIDLTDTAMERQTRREVERKVEDNRIVRELKAMLRLGYTPAEILAYAHKRVSV